MPLLSAPREAPSKWLTLAAACLGLGMLMVNTFVVNVALPAMARDLHAELATAQWIVSGFVLTLGVLPIAAGRLGDILGRREVYLAGLAIFLAGSLGCGLSQDVYVLIAFRLLQGVGAAVMQPATLSIVINAFPAHERGMAVGIWSGVSGLGLILGPILGGLLVHGDSWRYVFVVNLPVGAAALGMALRFVPRSRDETASRAIDWPGVGLLSGALFLIMFAVTRGNAEGWTSAFIVACATGGLLLLPLFVLRERRTPAPLVDLSLFRSTTFVMACVAAFLFNACVFGSQPYTSLFMQNYWGMSPLEGGLAFLPSTVLVALLMPLSGIMSQRLGHRLRYLVMGGAGFVGLSFLYLLTLDVESRYLDGFLGPFVLRGIGIGLVMTSTSLAVVGAVPLAKSGLASGTLTMARNVGTAMGVAILGAIYLQHLESEAPRSFAGAGPGGAASLTTAAERFLAPAGEFSDASAHLIVEGYILVAAACVVMALVATAAAFFIRPAAAPQTRPQPAVAAGLAQSAPTGGD